MLKSGAFSIIFKKEYSEFLIIKGGYVWRVKHLQDFWEDLIKLSGDRLHYTCVLALQDVSLEVLETDKEFYQVNDCSYKIYNVVDGQQSLITFVVFLQTFIDFVKDLSWNADRDDKEIYITDGLNLEAIVRVNICLQPNVLVTITRYINLAIMSTIQATNIFVIKFLTKMDHLHRRDFLYIKFMKCEALFL